MSTRTPWFIRLILLMATLCWTTAGFAQQPPVNKAPVPKGPTAAQMKMRTTTMARRRAAAQGIAKRRAAAGLKNQVGLNVQRGVKK